MAICGFLKSLFVTDFYEFMLEPLNTVIFSRAILSAQPISQMV